MAVLGGAGESGAWREKGRRVEGKAWGAVRDEKAGRGRHFLALAVTLNFLWGAGGQAGEVALSALARTQPGSGGAAACTAGAAGIAAGHAIAAGQHSAARTSG